MKRLSLLITALVIAVSSVIPTSVFAASGVDLSKGIEITDFIYCPGGIPGGILESGKSVTALCTISKVGKGSAEYTLITEVIKKGKIVDIVETSGVIKDTDGKIPVSTQTAPITGNPEDYKIITFAVNNKEDMIPLSSPAYFGGDNAKLRLIRVKDKEIYVEEGKRDYSVSVNAFTDELPIKIYAETYDLAATYWVSFDGTSGEAVINTVSANGQNTDSYNVSVNTRILNRASLASIKINGAEIPDYDPVKTDYILEAEGDKMPQISFEKALESTEVSVIYPETVPGTVVIKTVAEDKSEMMYNLQFKKTVKIPLSMIARTVNYKANVLQFAGNPNDFGSFQQPLTGTEDYTYGSKGTMMIWKAGSSEAYGGLAFKSSIPADAEILSAKLTVPVYAEDREVNTGMKDQAYGNLHLDITENDNPKWTRFEKSGEYKDDWKMERGKNAVVEDIDIPAQLKQETVLQSVTYDILPETVKGKSVIPFCVSARENSAGFNTFFTIPLTSEANMPSLEVSYTIPYVEPEKLSGIYIDGELLSGFDSDTFEYRVLKNKEDDTVPVITATAGSASTKVTIEQPKGIPGICRISTMSEDGKSCDYVVKFLKSVKLTPTVAAQGKYPSKLYKLSPEGFDKYQSYNYGGVGDMLTIHWANGAAVNGDSYSFFVFDTNIPENVVVEDAILELYTQGYNKMDIAPVHMDIYENTDLSWLDKADGENNISIPALSSEKINTEDVEVKVNQSNFNKTVFNLDKESVIGKEKFGMCAYTREPSNSYQKYIRVSIKTGYVPELTINYFVDE